MSTISSNLCHIALTGSSPIIAICYAPQSERKLCRAVINKYIQYTKNVSIFYNNSASLCGCCCRWKRSWKHYTAKEPPLRHCWWCRCRQQSEEREQKQRRRNQREIKKERRKKCSKLELIAAEIDGVQGSARQTQEVRQNQAQRHERPTLTLNEEAAALQSLNVQQNITLQKSDFDFTWESWMLCTGRNWNSISHISVTSPLGELGPEKCIKRKMWWLWWRMFIN